LSVLFVILKPGLPKSTALEDGRIALVLGKVPMRVNIMVSQDSIDICLVEGVLYHLSSDIGAKSSLINSKIPSHSIMRGVVSRPKHRVWLDLISDII
jgi:hypothetical protein